MLTREELRQLAQVESPESSAVTFYFQPQTPQNKSHREEAIQAKELVREALRKVERNGSAASVRADLKRILELAEQLHGNHARGKAVFACNALGIWRGFDLPSRLRRTQLYVNRRFHLRPLAAVAASFPRCCVALIDREKARLFNMWMGEINEQTGIFTAIPRRGRSDGFAGYDAGHAERHADNEAMRHFKYVSERLQEIHAREDCGAFIIGCRDDIWPQLEPHLHPYIKQKLLGRLAIDPAKATLEEVREQAQRIVDQREAAHVQSLLREVLGGAQRDGRGKVGLGHVLESLERGEVQALLFGRAFFAPAVECRHCGHLDTRMVKKCAACGRETEEVEDVADAIIRRAIDRGIEVVWVGDDPEFDKAGKIGALLRFRADQNTARKAAE